MATNHQPRRRFGQNFLRDIRVIQSIVSSANIQADETVVEIGPGQGALTEQLLSACGKLIAVELDRDLVPKLKERYLASHFEVIQADALKVDLSALEGQPFRLVGNLPYNISTPLLFHFFNHLSAWKDAHVMLQKEVALRITAGVGTSNYSRLSVMTQFYSQAELLFDVAPESFYPVPKVVSSIVRLVPREPVLCSDDARLAFESLVKKGFSQRRKTLSNNFKGVLSREQITQAGIDPGQRPQTLSVDDFVRLLKQLNPEME